MISQDEIKSYRKLYGDLIGCVPHYLKYAEEYVSIMNGTMIKLQEKGVNIFCQRGWHSGCDSKKCVCVCHLKKI